LSDVTQARNASSSKQQQATASNGKQQQATASALQLDHRMG